MSATAAGRGPLAFLFHSAGSQWLMIGVVGLGLLGGDKVLFLVRENLIRALTMTPSPQDVVAARTSQNLAPIVIHTGTSSGQNGSRGYFFLAIQMTLGAAASWAAYVCLSSLMPEAVKEVLPVNRKLFDRAVKSLGEGIIHVRDSLTEQIQALVQGQDELVEKQDKTFEEVKLVRDDLGEARDNLMRLDESIVRCESSLASSKRLHDYTSRGIRLLVRCVAGVMPANDRVLEELLQYIREAEYLKGVETKPASASLPIQDAPENEHPVLVPMSEERPKENIPKTPQRNDNLDAIHALLGLVGDSGNGAQQSPAVNVRA